MNGLRDFRLGLWIALAIVGLGSSAFAGTAYTEIKDNAFDGVHDTDYQGGMIRWHADDLDPGAPAYQQLTLLEDGIDVPGYTGNVVVDLTSTYQNFGSTLTDPARAYFMGGNLLLTFDYTLDGSIVTSHQLSGSITSGSVRVTSASDTLSTLTGIFNFDTSTAIGNNLPSSNNWPAPGLSTAVALTFAVGTNLSAYMTDAAAWENDFLTQTPVALPLPLPYGDTQFSFFPNEQPIPEPTVGLLFLAGGGLVIVRRRR